MGIGIGLAGRGGVELGLGRGGALAAAAPWWQVAGKTCVAAYQPKGAASYAASKVNLANPGTHDAAEGIAPSFDPLTGWYFNQVAWLSTGVVPGLAWTLLVRFSGHALGDKNCYLAGIRNSPWNNAFCLHQGYFAARTWFHGDQILSNGAAVAAGVQALAGCGCYMDGALIDTVASSGNAPADYVYIGGGRNAWPSWDGYIQAVALYSDTLSGAEIAAVSSAMAAL